MSVRHTWINLPKRYKADGIIYEQIKFCDYWGYERAFAGRAMREKFNYPVLSVRQASCCWKFRTVKNKSPGIC